MICRISAAAASTLSARAHAYEILHRARQLPPLAPDEKYLRFQRLFVYRLHPQSGAEAAHGWGNIAVASRPSPQHRAARVADAEHIRLQPLRVKRVHYELFIPPVDYQRPVRQRAECKRPRPPRVQRRG